MSCERSILVITTRIWKPSYVWTARENLFASRCLWSLQLIRKPQSLVLLLVFLKTGILRQFFSLDVFKHACLECVWLHFGTFSHTKCFQLQEVFMSSISKKTFCCIGRISSQRAWRQNFCRTFFIFIISLLLDTAGSNLVQTLLNPSQVLLHKPFLWNISARAKKNSF